MSNSFEVLNDYCSNNKRLTRSQLNHQQKLKALYHDDDCSPQDQRSDNPALENNNSFEGSSSHHPSSSSSSRGIRIQFVKENNLHKDNRRPQRSKKSSMSPAPLKEEEDGDSSKTSRGEGRRGSNSEVTKSSAVTVTPKLEHSPSPNTNDEEEHDAPPPPPPPLTKEELAEKAQRRAEYPMTNISEPGPNDCLFGRGGGTNHHPGNKRYRKMVESMKSKYLTSKRLDKPLVAMEIINNWRGLDPPGRFLKQDEVTKYWNDVGDKKAREKTSQALREKTPVKQREDGGGGGHHNHHHQHQHPHYDYREQRTAHFEPGTSSPVGRHVRKSNLARDHSLGTETMGANEISLEGFSWDDKDGPVVVRNENAPVEATTVGGGRRDSRSPPQQGGYPPHHSSHHHHHYAPHGEHYYGEHYQYYHEQHYRHPHHEGEHPEHGGGPSRYPYVREHSLSNNPLSDATTSHPAPPAFGEQPPPPPPPPHHSSYYGHYHSGYGPPPPPHSGYGPPPPPPPGPYSPPQSHHEYYSQHEYSQKHTQQQQPPQRGREHSLQMNPLKGATTSQPARDTFGEEESHASYDSLRPPPLPSPTYDGRGGPPPPPSPYYGGGYGAPSPTQQQGGGWPAPPHGGAHPSPQFSYHPGSNPSAFGRYNSGDRSGSIRSLGSSVDAFYDRRDSAAKSDHSGSASGGTPRTPAVAAAAAPSPAAASSPPYENPASAGTSQDYSKIAELIRDSSDKSSTMERSTSWDESGGVAYKEGNVGEYEDGILRSRSMPTGESNGGASGGSASSETRKPSLIRKLSGGGMARSSPPAAAPPNGIMRPSPVHGNNNVHRPEPVKRDTSNQPETFETKRSIKRVVLSRDQSAVARRLKEEQSLLANSNPHHPPNVKVGFDSATTVGGIGRPKLGGRVSSKLTKAEMLDRKLSVEMNKLGLDGLDDNANGVPMLDRMTTEDVLTSLIDSSSELPSPSPTITELINNPSDSSSACAADASSPPKPTAVGERVTTIDAIAMDIANGRPEHEWEDTLDLINEEGGVDEDLPNAGSGINADIAEKWLKGET